MGNKSWQELATKAKDIARRIVNGDEENKNGERLIHIVYRLDTFATNALNKKFAQSGSIGSVHTYAGGTQAISTRHADGSEGSFNTDGECTPTDNPMDIEVDAYINGGNGGGGGQSSPAAAMVLPESKTNKNMKKNVVKINENTLRQIVAESVKKVLKEGYNQQIVDEAIQAIFSIEDVVDKAKTQVGFNPNEGNREVAQLIMQIGTLIYRLKRTVYVDDYQEKWDRETHEQD